MKKLRIISLILALCLVLGMVPTFAFADTENTMKMIQLGSTGIISPTKVNETDTIAYYTPNSYIYFGVNSTNESTPNKWRVLDAKKTNDKTTDGIFMLSEYLLASDVEFRTTANSGGGFQGSDAQEWCQQFATDKNNFSSFEQDAMLGIEKKDIKTKLFNYDWYINYEDKLTSDDKLFLLSVQELADYVGNSYYYQKEDGTYVWLYKYFYAKNTDGKLVSNAWMLRSRVGKNGLLGVVSGGVINRQSETVTYCARPAFNLNPNSILFTSAAVGGKKSSATGAISKIADYTGNEWKVTLKDANRKFSITEEKASVKSGDTITLNYTDATVCNDEVPNEYISVIITDSDDNAIYYGRVMQPKTKSGRVSITIPSDLVNGKYTLNVFSEQYNGGANDDTKLTDYASAFSPVKLTVCDHTANTNKATCTESAVCSECGTPLPATGHTFGEWEVTKSATFFKDGEETRCCTNEGCTATETKVVLSKFSTFKSNLFGTDFLKAILTVFADLLTSNC